MQFASTLPTATTATVDPATSATGQTVSVRVVKLAFHDADTDSDTDILIILIII